MWGLSPRQAFPQEEGSARPASLEAQPLAALQVGSGCLEPRARCWLPSKAATGPGGGVVLIIWGSAHLCSLSQGKQMYPSAPAVLGKQPPPPSPGLAQRVRRLRQTEVVSSFKPRVYLEAGG